MNTCASLPLVSCRFALLAAVPMLLSVGAAWAQVAPAASGAAAPPASGEAVQLTRFTVTDDKDIGYESQQTTSGMRTVQELKNLANSISIMNSQFIEDLALTTMEEMATWMVSGESNPDPNATVQSRIILRGISNAYALRNGWIWYSPMDSFSTERIEELRGPNAFLYGEADVGGAQNQVTKRGLFTRDLNRVKVMLGSNEIRRVEIDLNRRLVKDKLAARFAAVAHQSESWIDNVQRDFRGLYGAVTYRPFHNTSVSLMAEHGRTQAVLSQGMFVDAFSRAATATLGNVGYIYNTATNSGFRAQAAGVPNRTISTGPAVAITDYTLVPKRTQSNGPDSTYNNATSSFTLEAEHHIGKNLHLQLTGNFYQQKIKNWTVNSRSITRDRSPLLPNGAVNPYFNELYTEYFRTNSIDGNIVRDIRFSAVYDLETRWFKQQFIANVQQHQDNPGQKKPKYVEYIDPASANWVGAINPAITAAAFAANRTTYAANRFYRRYYLRDGIDADRTGNLAAIPGVSTFLPDVAGRAATGQFINRRFYTPSWGVGASGTYFKDHLYTMVGYRRDHFNMNTTRGMLRAQKDWEIDYIDSFNTPALQFVQYKVDGANFGGVFRLNDMFAIGANYAQSFRISVGQGAATFNSGELSSIPVGEGTDLSARFSLFRDSGGRPRLELNIVRYKNFTPNARYAVPGVNQLLRDELIAIFPNTFDVTATGDYQTTLTRGNEVQAIANLTRNWRLSASYAANKVVNTDRAPLLKSFRAAAAAQNRPTPVLNDLLATIPEGLPNPGYTKARGNLFMRYQFTQDALRGFAIGGGGNWRLRTYRGTAALAAANATPTNLYSPAYTIYTAYLSYTRKIYNRNTSFQLNVDNVFDKEYYRSAAVGSGSWGDPRSFRFSMSTEL
ncbi:MAG: TonB-dependent receptor plug domain-containing protein [Opitutaceae bacterium]|nr:TonB-dependent receptor plug domain-containing protein [Opitutaceae bacterium]